MRRPRPCLTQDALGTILGPKQNDVEPFEKVNPPLGKSISTPPMFEGPKLIRIRTHQAIQHLNMCTPSSIIIAGSDFGGVQSAPSAPTGVGSISYVSQKAGGGGQHRAVCAGSDPPDIIEFGESNV